MKPSLKDILLLFLLGSMWGPSFMFIKISVHEIPPITLVAIRVSSAALILYTILRLNGRRLPGGKIWIRFAIMAFFASAFPFLLFAWGQQYIDSAMAGIINGSSPLVTVFLAHFFLDNDRLTWRKLIGILTGFSGLVALIGPSALEGMSFNTLGLIAAFVASGSYGVSFVYSRKYLIGLPRLVAPTAQFIMSGLMLIPVAFLIESPQTLPLPSTKVIVSMSALIIMGTAMAQVLYFYLVEQTSASFVSLVTYVIPIVAVILGVTVMQEHLTWISYLGTLMIFIGIMIVNNINPFIYLKTVNK